MTIEEFSKQLGRDEHPTRLMEALRTLQTRDLSTLKQPHALYMAWGDWSSDGGGGSPQPGADRTLWAGDWLVWTDDHPRTYAERPELRS